MQSMEITTRIGCINMCSYCPQEMLIRAYRSVSTILEMDMDTFRTCVEKIPASVNIHFSGLSEPWLNPHCTEMVAYAHKRGHKLQVYTTLVGMTPKDIDSISGIPFEILIVHLPDADKATRIEVNGNYLELVVRAAKLLTSAAFIYYDSIHPLVEPLVKAVPTAKWELTSRAQNVRLEGAKTTPIRGHIRCTRSLRQNVLLPNGDVVLCCNDYGMKHVLGNLMRCDYDSLFSGAAYREVTAGLIDESAEVLCRRCETFTEPAGIRKAENYGGRMVRRMKELFTRAQRPGVR
jgi:sulfatase maturation enzyme AslB (radical SAM superfamily)